MISIFKKLSDERDIVVELKKVQVADFIVDNFHNDLLFPGNVLIKIKGISDDAKKNVKWELIDIGKNETIKSGYGEDSLTGIPCAVYGVNFGDVNLYELSPVADQMLNELGTLVFVADYTRVVGDFKLLLASDDIDFKKDMVQWELSSSTYRKTGFGEVEIKDLKPDTYFLKLYNYDELNYNTPESKNIVIEKNKVFSTTETFMKVPKCNTGGDNGGDNGGGGDEPNTGKLSGIDFSFGGEKYSIPQTHASDVADEYVKIRSYNNSEDFANDVNWIIKTFVEIDVDFTRKRALGYYLYVNDKTLQSFAPFDAGYYRMTFSNGLEYKITYTEKDGTPTIIADSFNNKPLPANTFEKLLKEGDSLSIILHPMDAIE